MFIARADTKPHGRLAHEAFLYSGFDEFVTRASQFVREAVATDEAIMVMVGAAKITALKQELNGVEGPVTFADMETIGRNPAQLMPAWQEFADQPANVGRPLRGIGEPERLNPPLPAPADSATTLTFTTAQAVDDFVERFLGAAGFSTPQRVNFRDAARILATNCLTHGNGRGSLQIWIDGHTAVCELRNSGQMTEPLAGRQTPPPGGDGSGLWIANQLCDLIQIRTSSAGTTVRAHLQHSHTDSSRPQSGWKEFGDDWITVYQATGMVSVQLATNTDDALIALRADAYTTGRNLSDIAADVVSRTARYPHA